MIPGCNLILKSQKYSEEKTLKSIRTDNNIGYIKFSGVDSITQAFKIVGYDIYSDMTGNDLSAEDYSGFRIIDIEKNEWGIVEGFESEGMNRVIKSNLSGTIFLIPFIFPIVIDIDKKEKLIRIDPPEGLRKLNL